MSAPINQTFPVPSETMWAIFDNLSLRDLKTFRAANRSMKELVDGYLQDKWKVYKNYKWSDHKVTKILETLEGSSYGLIQKIEKFAHTICNNKEINLLPSFLNKKVQEANYAVQTLWEELIKSHRGLLPKENTISQWSVEEIKSWLNDNPDNLAQIEELNLNGKELSCIPPEIKYFKGLTRLYLENNQITSLPEGIFTNLQKLKHITLDHNQITSVSEETFVNLPQLNQILLDHNQITSVSEETFVNLPQLKQITLNHNQLTTLPTRVFVDVQNLRLITLNNNPITSLTNGFLGDSSATISLGNFEELVF